MANANAMLYSLIVTSFIAAPLFLYCCAMPLAHAPLHRLVVALLVAASCANGAMASTHTALPTLIHTAFKGAHLSYISRAMSYTHTTLCS